MKKIKSRNFRNGFYVTPEKNDPKLAVVHQTTTKENEMKEDDDLYTSVEVCNKLRIKISTLYGWVCRHPEKLRVIKIGRLNHFKRSDVEQFIEKSGKGGGK